MGKEVFYKKQITSIGIIMKLKPDFQERDIRYNRIRTAMKEQGLQALIVAASAGQFTRGNIRYLADAHLWAGHGLILFPLESDPMYVQLSSASSGVPDPLWIADYRRSPTLQRTVGEAMKEKSITKGKVGLVGYESIMTVGQGAEFVESSPHIEFVNADLLMDKVRAIKSPLEIAQLKDVWKVSVEALDNFAKNLQPGISQREAASAAASVFRRAGCWDDMNIIAEGSSKGLPKDIPLKCNDLVSFHLEICGEYGQWSEVNTVCAFRDPSKEEQRLLSAELKAHQAICSAAKPGVTLEGLGKVFSEVIQQEGFVLAPPEWHHFFHGQGLDAVEWPFYSDMGIDNKDAPLEAGMVLSYHPHRDTLPLIPNRPAVFDGLIITNEGGERLNPDFNMSWRIMN